MNICEYINYWETVIRAWLDNDICNSDLSNEITQVLLSPKLKDVLRWHHIPGPYMGNPKSCSIVILNYNPGGRFDLDPMKCHRCLRCCRNYYSIINYVDRHGYFEFAKDFPYLNSNINDELKRSLDGGKEWWEKKKEWIDNLTCKDRQVESTNVEGEKCKVKSSVKNTKYPFAMEVCGWHSAKWPSDALDKLDKNNGLGKHIGETVVKPMIDVIKKNNTFGVCVGKKLGDMLLNFSFENDTNNLIPYLSKLYTIPSPNKIKVSDVCINVQFDKNQKKYNIAIESITKSKSKGRYYRLLKLKHDECKDNIYMLNTWVAGSNKHSSDDFFKFEREIVCYINCVLNNLNCLQKGSYVKKSMGSSAMP